jgi:hypothetical protein
MTIADLVYKQVKLLPDPLAREVLDFVGFLREGRDRAEWRDLMNAHSSLQFSRGPTCQNQRSWPLIRRHLLSPFQT